MPSILFFLALLASGPAALSSSKGDIKTLLVCGKWPEFLYILQNEDGSYEQLVSTQSFVGQTHSNDLQMQLIKSDDHCVLEAKPKDAAKAHIFKYKFKKGSTEIEHLALANGKDVPEDMKKCRLHETYVDSLNECHLDGIVTRKSETEFCLKCLLDAAINGEINGTAPIKSTATRDILAVSRASLDQYIVGEWALYDLKKDSKKQAFPPLVIRRSDENQNEFEVVSCPDFLRIGNTFECRPRLGVWLRRYGSLKMNDEFQGVNGQLGGNLFGPLTSEKVALEFVSDTNFNIIIGEKSYQGRRIVSRHLY